MERFLPVAHLTPVATGKTRSVYVHPNNPDLIVKVPTPIYVRQRAGEGAKWHKRLYRSFIRSRHFLVFQREIEEHLAVRAQADPFPPYVQAIVGFVETDRGMGLVSRAVRGRDGALAPTLYEIVRAGRFTPAMREKLEAFYAWMLESPLVVGDLTIVNLVYGYAPEVGEHFVMIDGIGDKNLIPFNSLSTRLNRRAKLRAIKRLDARILHYTPKGGTDVS